MSRAAILGWSAVRSMAPQDGSERIFYDGTCGLCHGGVLFVLRHERTAEVRFRYAPLQGKTYRAEVGSAAGSRHQPDTLVVQTTDGELLERSDGVIHILRRVGGGWGGVAAALALCPRPLRDGAYDLVARWRSRLARRPAALCPEIPVSLADRFDP
jgi:predicted DCC family thiol-disulfide oxidoreductase YuxK